MTIAACYVSSEGVVLGADSTSSYQSPSGSTRHYNNAQKLFEVGDEGSTLGIVTWGLAGLADLSYRHCIADLSDSLLSSPPQTVLEAAERWIVLLWRCYEARLQAPLQRYQSLASIQNPTPQDIQSLEELRSSLLVGFCLGGHVKADRKPCAYVMLFDPANTLPPQPVEIIRNRPVFWGIPIMMDRLLKGIDGAIYSGIQQSPHWTGQKADLDAIVAPYNLSPGADIPLREAIDWIFSSIFVTIKALKFSALPPFCGGPIEVAAITADRRFRWVCHKGLDQALSDHIARRSD